MPVTVVHALAVRITEAGTARIRATLRAGALAEGDDVWFVSRAAVRRTARIRAVAPGRRHLVVELEGPHLGDLHAGVYLYCDR